MITLQAVAHQTLIGLLRQVDELTAHDGPDAHLAFEAAEEKLREALAITTRVRKQLRHEKFTNPAAGDAQPLPFN